MGWSMLNTIEYKIILAMILGSLMNLIWSYIPSIAAKSAAKPVMVDYNKPTPPSRYPPPSLKVAEWLDP